MDRAERLDSPFARAFGRHDRADKLGGGRGKQQATRGCVDTMTRPTDALQAPRDAPRQAHLNGQIGRSDIDAELEAGTGNDGTERPRLQRGLDLATTAGIERGVVRGDSLRGVAKHQAEVMRHFFGQGARVLAKMTVVRLRPITRTRRRRSRR